MSSPFNGKQIVEAFYTNEAHDTIQIIYNDNEDLTAEPSYVTMYIPGTDPDNYDLKNLFAEGYDYERIQKETILHNQEQATIWRQIIRSQSQQDLEKIKAEYQEKYDHWLDQGPAINSSILQAVMDNNVEEEALFRSKLASFELPDIKAKATKEDKQKIRTAKSMLELFAVLHNVLK